jgi:hypothetical protein
LMVCLTVSLAIFAVAVFTAAVFAVGVAIDSVVRAVQIPSSTAIISFEKFLIYHSDISLMIL